ncbi:MFS transporter [Nocardia higoensis]|uniref:MFS transporter n=1 Tax=Nocardia higoensis TaxID=228599 RepID=A0ABS0DDY5_9NOCA|nr:MFS transporter [Nocardia higoensis]MBF6356345.1 MFS transporter [Nocardia higoensis]
MRGVFGETAQQDTGLRFARAAVFTVFGVNGFLLAMWVVHIPAVTDRTGVSHSALGMFILLMAGAGIVGMRVAGPLADRFGSRALVGAAAAVAALAVVGPGLATGPLGLGIALACFGFGNGALDVSMNAQAVHLERAYRRPIMSAFHALFSGGGLLGSLLGAAALRAGMDLRVTLVLACVAGLALVGLCVPRLLADSDTTATPPATPAGAGSTVAVVPATLLDPPASAATPSTTESASHATPPQPHPAANASTPHRSAHVGDDRAAQQHPVTPANEGTLAGPPAVDPFEAPGTQRARQRHGRKVLALGVIAFAVLLTEGVAADWSTLQMRERLGVDDATAALAFAAFSVTMTGGRLVADRVSGSFGPVAVVRYGMLLAALGTATIMISPWTPLTLTGWALCGLGLSGSVPQIFTAAGNLGSGTAATDMSRVFALGYVGLLAGPASIGGLTELVPLSVAMVVPLIAVLICALSADVVDTRRSSTP